MHSHYIPEMYLKGWSTTFRGQEKHIRVYTKGRNPRFKAISAVAWHEDYYTYETEKMFAREIETKTEPILQKLIREEQLILSERTQLSRFIFLLWQRVPFNRKGLFRQIRQHTKPAMLKEMRKMMSEILPKKLRRSGLLKQALDVENTEYSKEDEHSEHEHKLFSELMMRATYNQYQAFMRMNWRIHRAAPGKIFVTTDNPVFIDRRLGLSDRMFSFFIFPISEHLVMRGRLSGMVGRDFEPISEQETEFFNREIIKNCDEQVYASRDDADIFRLVQECAGDAQAIKHTLNIKVE